METIKLRPYQREALTAVREIIEAAPVGKKHINEGKIIHPCGTGKTILSMSIIKELEKQRVVIFLPNLSLVKQTLDVFSKHLDAQFLAICSDKSVAQEEGVDCEVTTDTKGITSFMRRAKRKGTRIVFCTYQSSKKLAACPNDVSFDLALYDEAHRICGKKGSSFQECLEIRTKKKLFMTATPKVYADSVRGLDKKENFIDMSMAEIFGETIHKYSFQDAIKQNYLSDYNVYGVATKENVQTSFRSYAFSILQHVFENNTKKLIVYFSNLTTADKFLHSWKELFPDVAFELVSGETPAGKRKEVFNKIKNAEKGVLLNVRTLTEGVDIPAIDSVLFVDPKYSHIDIVQSLGRCIRLYEGKEFGKVYVPIVVDQVGNVDNDKFEMLTKVFNGLKDHDDYLENLLVDYKQGDGVRTKKKKEKITILADEDLENVKEKIMLQTIEKLGGDWLTIYDKLKEFVKKNKRMPKAKENGLGGWCSRQRSRYKRKWRDYAPLRDFQIDLLEEIPGWFWIIDNKITYPLVPEKFERELSKNKGRKKKYVDRTHLTINKTLREVVMKDETDTMAQIIETALIDYYGKKGIYFK